MVVTLSSVVSRHLFFGREMKKLSVLQHCHLLLSLSLLGFLDIYVYVPADISSCFAL
jgi:hypothetical protein